jgi:hypothetical protein
MRLILASNFSHDGLIAHLERRHTQVADHRLALQQTAEAMDDGADLGDLLALGYGLTVAAAELAWLDQIRVHLSQSSSSVEVVQDNLATRIQYHASSVQDTREND